MSTPAASPSTRCASSRRWRLFWSSARPPALRFFGPGYAHGGSTLLRLLALALIPNVIVAIGLSVARIQHDGRLVILIQGALCVPIVGLSLLLLPRLGIEGVGVACLVGQTAVASWLLLGRLRSAPAPRGGARGG